MLKTTFIAVSVFIFLPMLASAETKVSDCQGNFTAAGIISLNQSTEIKSLDQLPKKIFVAQTADYLITSKTSETKLWGRQSFITTEGKVMCATLKDQGRTGFAMLAPTLIDLSETHTVGNSFWQFHMTIDDQHVGIWNQKSRFSPRSSDFLLRMQEGGIKVYGEMVSSTRYQLHFVRESPTVTEHLRIRYDLTNDLP
jgi:hypothetical protein